MKDTMLRKFAEIFGDAEGVQVYFAPGRVNLIGEHTDYNGGHVFPCALTIGTYGAVRKRPDRKLRFYSMNFERLGVLESSLDELKPDPRADWTNYPKGVIWAFGEKGLEASAGMDFLLYGNIPNGSGLSSSASVEVLTGFILRDLFGFAVSNQDLALIDQNFTLLVQTLQKWAEALHREGYAREARQVLEYAVLAIQSDAGTSYRLLASLYDQENEQAKVAALYDAALHLTSPSGKTIARTLLKAYPYLSAAKP